MREQALAVECAIDQGLDPKEAHEAQIANHSDNPQEPFLKSERIKADQLSACMTDEDMAKRLTLDLKAVQYLGINSTPTWIIGNRIVRGYLPPDQVQGLLRAYGT